MLFPFVLDYNNEFETIKIYQTGLKNFKPKIISNLNHDINYIQQNQGNAEKMSCAYKELETDVR